jgi:hypothetical protein
MAVGLLTLRAGRPLPSQEDSWYSFLLEAESTPRALVRLEGLGKLKKIHLIETPNLDLQACIIVTDIVNFEISEKHDNSNKTFHFI